MAIPIPKRASGFSLGDPDASVVIDVFVDIQCPHSKQAWPIVCDLIEHYKDQAFSVTTHLITLSNHRQAWDMSLALFAAAEGDARRFYDFASHLYLNQAQYYNAEFEHKTHADLKHQLASVAAEFFDMDADKVLKRMADHDIYIDARTPIRYAATKSVWATPTFFINNADDVPVSFKSPFEDWTQLIDELLS